MPRRHVALAVLAVLLFAASPAAAISADGERPLSWLASAWEEVLDILPFVKSRGALDPVGTPTESNTAVVPGSEPTESRGALDPNGTP